jgi:hypothetical protein
MPEEKLIASRPLLKAPVELIELPGEGFTQILLVAYHLSFAGIRKDRNSGLPQLNELRLGTKVYRVLPLRPAKHIQIALQLCSVISRCQNYGRVIGHFDQPVDPEVTFFNRGLVRGEVAVHYKKVYLCPDGIGDKPFQTLRGVGEVVVFSEVEIASVAES